MADNSLFAVLLRSRWWVSALVAAVLGLLGTALMPVGWKVAGALSGFPFAVIAVMAAWRQRHRPSEARIVQVDAALRAMAWPAFADLLEQAFRRDGHQVTRVTGAADFELLRQGKTLLVCARRWKGAHVGVEPLRELQALREETGAAALFIGLGARSDAATAFAAQHRIAFWGAAEVAESLHGLPLPAPKVKNR